MVDFDKRRRWIINWLKAAIEKGACNGCDVLNEAFSDAYIKANEVRFRPTSYGAMKCPQLGADLSRMAKEGSLTRCRIGIKGMAGQGFPSWVWSYQLAEHLR